MRVSQNIKHGIWDLLAIIFFFFFLGGGGGVGERLECSFSDVDR